MKWTNKGHEFDTVYQNIEKKDKFYLFGAGEYGEAVYQELEDKLPIAGFIDNNPEKQKENYLRGAGCSNCYSHCRFYILFSK